MKNKTTNTQNKFKKRLERLLEGLNISFNGNNPWDIQVYNPRLYARIFTQGSLGFGEAYMDGWWECEQIDELFNKILTARLEDRFTFNLPMLLTVIRAHIANQQTMRRASQAVQRHYDRGNDLYTAMLDKRLTYTCGYWKNAATLDEAQEHKYDLVCRKLNLKPGQKILDIGCGWGGFMRYAAEKYGVECIGVTLSKEQVKLGRELCQGLPIDFYLMDYRELHGTYDHIVSLGMFEHVGYKNYETYMQIVREHLKENGLFLLHTIGGNESTTSTDPWIAQYIFPGSMLPSIKQIATAIEGKFVMEDWHNFGPYYDKTLCAWHENFARNWVNIKSNYDERFYRMWKYYLLSCAGSFRARRNELWQIVLSPHGVPGGYSSVR